MLMLAGMGAVLTPLVIVGLALLYEFGFSYVSADDPMDTLATRLAWFVMGLIGLEGFWIGLVVAWTI